MGGGGAPGPASTARMHTRCPYGGAVPLLPISPRVAAWCTSGLPMDSSDGPELISCDFEGWDEHSCVSALPVKAWMSLGTHSPPLRPSTRLLCATTGEEELILSVVSL